MRKPKHLFRDMTAKEVEELWTKLVERVDKEERNLQRCMTSDGEGVRFLARDEFNKAFHQKQAFEEARFMLVDLLSKKDNVCKCGHREVDHKGSSDGCSLCGCDDFE